MLSMESKKTMFERRPNAVSDTRVMIVKNRHRKPLHPPNHNKCVEEEELQRLESILEVRSTAVQRLLGRCLH